MIFQDTRPLDNFVKIKQAGKLKPMIFVPYFPLLHIFFKLSLKGIK